MKIDLAWEPLIPFHHLVSSPDTEYFYAAK